MVVGEGGEIKSSPISQVMIVRFPLEAMSLLYCRIEFDSNGLTAAKTATENDRYYWNSLQKLYSLYLI